MCATKPASDTIFSCYGPCSCDFFCVLGASGKSDSLESLLQDGERDVSAQSKLSLLNVKKTKA